MNSQTPQDYLLLFRGNAWLKQLPDHEVQRIVTDWANWFQGLVRNGKCAGGLPLQDAGKLVSGKSGLNVTDGPFAESKEAVGGFFHLRVTDEPEAIAIAQQCPGLEHGCVVEVRPAGEPCIDRARAFEVTAVTR